MVLKRYIRRAKRVYCHELTEAIYESTPTKQLWNIIKGLDTALTQPVGRKPEITLEDANKFMTHYYDHKLKHVRQPAVETPPELTGYEMALAIEETLGAQGRTKNFSAPGEDGMSYAALKTYD